MKTNKCRFCNSTFSDEILKKIKLNTSDVYCESCGDLIKRVPNGYITDSKVKNEIPPIIPFITNKPPEELNIPPDALLYPNGRVYYDTDFPQNFKSNFVIVFSRLIYFTYQRIKKEGYLDTEVMGKFENLVNEIHRCTSSIHEKRIKCEVIENLHEITIDEFNFNLKKLQQKFRSNKSYREDFIVYSRTLIGRILTIISDKKEISKLSKFELVMINDLKNFGFSERSVDLTPADTNKKSNSILEKPAKRVNHYYDALGKCRRNSGSAIRRHNYIIIGKQQISCVDCGHTILNSDIKESNVTLRKSQLIKLDRNKQAGDITIYRISTKKVLKNGKLVWLPFPGLNYVGQTMYTGEERLKSHTSSAFRNDTSTSEFDKFILDSTYKSLSQPNKKKAKSLIKKNFKVEILQIVRFQGEWEAIRKIIDQDELQKKIKKADRSTEKLANEVEKFWIGWYKTQYEEFGKNIEEGGSLRGSTAADLMDVDILFRQGYLPVQIGRKVGLQGNDDSIRKTVTGYIKFRLYPSIFYPNGVDNPAISFRDGRRIIFRGILDDLVKKGIKNYKELTNILPGFYNSKAEGRLKWQELKRIALQTHGGIRNLVNEHHHKDPKNYYDKALELIKKKREKIF